MKQEHIRSISTTTNYSLSRIADKETISTTVTQTTAGFGGLILFIGVISLFIFRRRKNT